MTLSKRAFLGCALAVAALQTAVLGYFVFDRLHLLKTGREITLPVVPLDPRDIFRGDYVNLGNNFSMLNHSAAKDGPLPAGLQRGGVIYVTISPTPEGPWKVVRYGATYPKDAAGGDAVLKGRISSLYGSEEGGEYSLGVRYGIESFFVPEGTGKDLEQQVRDRKIEAVLAIGPDGTAAIKGLVIDGQRHDDPPLF